MDAQIKAGRRQVHDRGIRPGIRATSGPSQERQGDDEQHPRSHNATQDDGFAEAKIQRARLRGSTTSEGEEVCEYPPSISEMPLVPENIGSRRSRKPAPQKQPPLARAATTSAANASFAAVERRRLLPKLNGSAAGVIVGEQRFKYEEEELLELFEIFTRLAHARIPIRSGCDRFKPIRRARKSSPRAATRRSRRSPGLHRPP